MPQARRTVSPEPSIRSLSDLPPGADVVVIGGGVVGAATAFHAARAGLRPVLLERRPALCTLTTAVAAGGFRLQQDDEEDLALVRESVANTVAQPAQVDEELAYLISLICD